MSDNIKPAILVRVSSIKQAQGDSLDHQEIRCASYISTKGWPEPVTVYRLEGVSGKDVDKHPEMIRLMADVAAGRVNVLVFSRLDRVARSFHTLVKIGLHFKECEAHLVSLKESLDTSTTMGRFFFYVLALIAELERERIQERVKDVVPLRAEMGKKMGGIATYGYEWVDGRLEVVKAEAEVRKLIYDLFLKHGRQQAVANELNTRNYTTRSGDPWTAGYVARMIEDTTAKGQRRVNWSGSPQEGKAPIIKPESEWVYHPCPAIVSVDIWTRANELLASQRKEQTPRQKRPKRLFGNVVWCACGGKMYGDARPAEGQAFRCAKPGCQNKLRINLLEQAFVSRIETFFGSSQAETALTKRHKQNLSELTRLLRARKKELDQLEQEKARVKKERLINALPAAYIAEFYQDYEAQKAGLTLEIPRLEGEIAAIKHTLEHMDQTIEQARQIAPQWSEMRHDQKLTLIDQIVERITIGKRYVQFEVVDLPEILRFITDSEYAKYHTRYAGVSEKQKARHHWAVDKPKPPDKPKKNKPLIQPAWAAFSGLCLSALRALCIPHHPFGRMAAI